MQIIIKFLIMVGVLNVCKFVQYNILYVFSRFFNQLKIKSYVLRIDVATPPSCFHSANRIGGGR